MRPRIDLKNYSNAQIEKLYKSAYGEYLINKEAEKIAEIFLKEYDESLRLTRFSKNTKVRYYELEKEIHRRQLSPEIKTDNIQIPLYCIIDRIRDNRNHVIDYYKNFSNKYVGYCGNNEWDIEEIITKKNHSGINIKIREVNEKYEKIINDVMSVLYDKKIVYKNGIVYVIDMVNNTINTITDVLKIDNKEHIQKI